MKFVPLFGLKAIIVASTVALAVHWGNAQIATEASVLKVVGAANGRCAQLIGCQNAMFAACVNGASYIANCSPGKPADDCEINDVGGTSPCGTDSKCNGYTGGYYAPVCGQ